MDYYTILIYLSYFIFSYNSFFTRTYGIIIRQLTSILLSLSFIFSIYLHIIYQKKIYLLIPVLFIILDSTVERKHYMNNKKYIFKKIDIYK